MCVRVCPRRRHQRSIVNQQSTRGLRDQPIDSLPGKSIQSKALLKLNSDLRVEEDARQERERKDGEEDAIRDGRLAEGGSEGGRSSQKGHEVRLI